MRSVKLGRDTKRIQNIAQGYGAFELVYVGAANNGQEFELGRAQIIRLCGFEQSDRHLLESNNNFFSRVWQVSWKFWLTGSDISASIEICQ